MYIFKNRVLSLFATIMLLVSGNMSLCIDNDCETIEGKLDFSGGLRYAGRDSEFYRPELFLLKDKITIRSKDMGLVMKNPATVVVTVKVYYNRDSEMKKKLLSRYKDRLLPEGKAEQFNVPASSLKNLRYGNSLDMKSCDDKGEDCINFKFFLVKNFKNRFDYSEQTFIDLVEYHPHDEYYLLESGIIAKDPKTGEIIHGPNGYKKMEKEES